jgi:hypothetical protein
MFMMYFTHSVLTNVFRVIPVLLQDYKGTNVVLCCVAATTSHLKIITISVENI